MGGSGGAQYKLRHSKSQRADGSVESDRQHNGYRNKDSERERKAREDSFVGYMNTKKGNQVVMGVLLYGVALVVLIILLVTIFTGEPNEEFYVAPARFSPYSKSF